MRGCLKDLMIKPPVQGEVLDYIKVTPNQSEQLRFCDDNGQ